MVLEGVEENSQNNHQLLKHIEVRINNIKVIEQPDPTLQIIFNTEILNEEISRFEYVPIYFRCNLIQHGRILKIFIILQYSITKK